MPSVGEELKRERELRGIDLEEIAEETKIGVRFLEAIDSDRLEIIPGEFYRRAAIRAYARYLGIDEDRIVATYEFDGAAGTASPRPSEELRRSADRPFQTSQPSGASWAAWTLVGLGLCGAAFAVWPRGSDSVLVEAPVAPPAQITAKAPEPILHDEIEEPQPLELPLRLLLEVNESCWLEIHADGSLTDRGLMLRGFRKAIQAREEIRLWLGNAGGVSVWINEQAGRPLGRPGEVRKDIRITPDNIGEFVASEEEQQAGPASL